MRIFARLSAEEASNDGGLSKAAFFSGFSRDVIRTVV